MKTKRAAKKTTTSAGSSPLSIPIGTSRDGAIHTHEYLLGRPKDGMTDEEKERLQARFDELRAEKRPVYDQKVRAKEMSENEAAAALMHEVFTQLAGEFKIGYCRVLRRVGFEPVPSP